VPANDGQPTDPQTAVAKVKNGAASTTVKLSAVHLWDPNSPNLYNVRLRLRHNATVHDLLRTYFGMRKVDFEIAKDSGVRRRCD